MADFAEPKDVETRLGRPLSDKENDVATSVITTVTGLIADSVGRDAAWAEGLDPVPEALKSICVEKAIGAIANPTNLASSSEALGAYSRSQTFPRSADVSVFLSEFEERLIDRAVYGNASTVAYPESTVDRVIDLREGREPE